MAGIVVIGTGGMGREALAWLEDVGRTDQVFGFLDDDRGRHGTTLAGAPVLGALDWLDDRPEVEAVVALGDPAARRRTAEALERQRVGLATVVHPSAVIGPRVSIGAGSIICPGVILTCDVTIGRAAIVNYGAAIGHDGRIGDWTFIAPGARLAGAVTVGAEAYVGIGASVIQERTIGQGAVVGAGAVVVSDVAPDTTVVGVPARPVEART